jgi:IS605 OrfB family transposase
LTLQAYRFALDATPTQERMLRSHCGASRVAFNWGLAQVKAVMGQREAEATYGIGKQDLTPTLSWSLYSLRKEWNAAKADVAPWWGECSKEAFNTGLDGLARSLKNWGDSRSGRRKGAPVGFPRFKSRRRSSLSVRFTTGAIRCQTHHAVLPRLGRIKLHEDASGLVQRVNAGDARVMSAAVRFGRGRWFVSFTVDLDRPATKPAHPDAVVGVDLGITTLAVLSTGVHIPNPRHLNGALRKVRHLSRTVSRRIGPYDCATKRRRPPSNRWRQAAAALAKAQGRVGDQRKDSTHKLTTMLAKEYGTVVVEDLFVAGIVRNHRLARHVADASFGQIRRQLEYKTVWNGGRTVVADRWFPSSKTCSGCGAVKTKLALSERTYVCTMCGLVLDRDVNAARNLAVLGEAMVAGSGPETLNGRGGEGVLALPAKRQPGTAPAGKAGIVQPQGRTALRELTNAH